MEIFKFQREGDKSPKFIYTEIPRPNAKKRIPSGSFSNLVEQEAGTLAQDYIAAMRGFIDWGHVMGELTASTSLHLKRCIFEVEKAIRRDLRHRNNRFSLGTHGMGPIALINTLRVLLEKAPRSIVQHPDGSATYNAPLGDTSLWLPPGFPEVEPVVKEPGKEGEEAQKKGKVGEEDEEEESDSESDPSDDSEDEEVAA